MPLTPITLKSSDLNALQWIHPDNTLEVLSLFFDAIQSYESSGRIMLTTNTGTTEVLSKDWLALDPDNHAYAYKPGLVQSYFLDKATGAAPVDAASTVEIGGKLVP